MGKNLDTYNRVSQSTYLNLNLHVIMYNFLDCFGALGMENGAISNGQLQASTEWDAYLSVPQGRLHHPRCWAARINDVNQWYQIDLRSQYTRVTAVATQGRGDHPQWVTRYKLQYNNDGANFHYYRENGQAADKVGNSLEGFFFFFFFFFNLNFIKCTSVKVNILFVVV